MISRPSVNASQLFVPSMSSFGAPSAIGANVATAVVGPVQQVRHGTRGAGGRAPTCRGGPLSAGRFPARRRGPRPSTLRFTSAIAQNG